ncbi:hypothetical protein RRG08_010324 [Elysia crispata]|uniref:Uncharacterized protein n=1 Tax=Elysia crispata TaxID=231223 RepID=A0AAE1CTS3_9GAST|nr:hypothetical protein RRG08_010324 [Elysia crispata]
MDRRLCSRHLITVHNVDRYDVIEAKRKKKKCPLCGRMVTNLLRHLNEVEKIVRNSDEYYLQLLYTLRFTRRLHRLLALFRVKDIQNI